MNKFPFGVKSKVTVPLSVKKDGANATFSNRGFYGAYFDQLLYDLQCDHVWGTQAQTLTDDATFYTDGSGNPLDKTAVAVTINEDDKILINHNATQTAALLLDAGGVKFTLEMLDTVTLNMGSYDLTLGGTGDSIAGDIRLIGTGTLTIEDSDGLRVQHTAMTVVSSVGDVVINNEIFVDGVSVTDVVENSAIDWQATSLVMSIPTVATVDVDATKIQLVSGDNVIKIIEPLDVTLTMPADINAGSEKASTWYEAYISANVAGTVGKKLVPILTGTTTSTSSGNLADSGATFLTDLVLQHSIVLNTTDGTSTTVSLDAAAEGTFAVTDDIFTSGEDYTIYLVPTFDSGHIFYAKPGRVFNDSGSDFTEFVHTQPINIPDYGNRAAKVWANIDGTGAISITDSYNVSSIVDNGVGDYTINFIDALPNADYTVVGNIESAPSAGTGWYFVDVDAGTAKTTTSVRINTSLGSASVQRTLTDIPFYINIFGS